MTANDAVLTDAEIARSASRGAIASITRSGLIMVLQTAGSLVVAHLIAPRSYGIWGLALTVVGALRYVGDLGVTYRLEVLRSIDDDDVRRALAIGLATAAAGAVLVSLIWQLLPLVHSGPAGARFVAPVLALTLVISAPSGPATAKLYRRLAFRTAANAGLLSSFVLFGLELPLLFAGLGIWALVIGYVAAAIVNTGYLLVAARGLPLPGWRRPILRFIQRSLPYQAPLLAQATVGLVSATLVAALLGAKGVGFFTWATVLATPIVTVVFTLEAVVAPSLARMLRDDGSQYSQATSVVLLTFAALSATAVGAFIGLVPPIVRFVFGARWLPAVGATQLALAGVVPASLVAGCASVVNSQDQPGKRLRASLAAGATAVILTVPITLAAGVAGAAAVAYVVCPLVEVVVLAPSARAGLGYLGIRIARLGLPLAAGSFALARAATSPALLVASVAAMAVAATTLLVLAERDLVRSLWRRIASPPAVAP